MVALKIIVGILGLTYLYFHHSNDYARDHSMRTMRNVLLRLRMQN